MQLPNDPVILLSFINTRLRDESPSLADLCRRLEINQPALEKKLSAIDYVYDPAHNQFV